MPCADPSLTKFMKMHLKCKGACKKGSLLRRILFKGCEVKSQERLKVRQAMLDKAVFWHHFPLPISTKKTNA